MQAVIYTTSSLAPKNLLSFLLSLFLHLQLKQRVQVEDSKVPGCQSQHLEGAWEPEDHLEQSLLPASLTPTGFQEPEGRNELFLCPVIGVAELSVSAITLH